MKKAFIYIAFFSLIGSVFGQDLKKDLASMAAYYKDIAYLTIDINVKVYQANSKSPLYTQDASIRKKGTQFFYEMGQSRMIMTDKNILMVQDKEKKLLLQPVKDGAFEKYMNRQLAFNLDSIIAKYDSLVYKGASGKRKHYIVYTSSGMIAKTELYIDEGTNALSKVTYYYNQKLQKDQYKVDIGFANSTAPFSENLFSINKYVSKTGNKYKLNPAYNSYNLIITSHED